MAMNTSTRGFVVWLTGLPCSGKSTLARELALRMDRASRPCEILDGDIVREHLSRGLGFSRGDRDTNVRRIGFVAGLLARHGVAVVVAVVSPYRETRQEVRRAIEPFVEIFVDCPLSVCESRDLKGMYARSRRGELPGFTGVDDPYEPPLDPDLVVSTGSESVDESIERILVTLTHRGYF